MSNVSQQVFNLQMESAEKNQCNNLFQTYFVVGLDVAVSSLIMIADITLQAWSWSRSLA
jgi:hypothetical protein